MRRKIVARFIPQIWVNDDYGMNVEPLGPDQWELSVTDEEWKRLSWDDYARDDLIHDPAAPAWVKDWPGPFEVDVEEKEDAQ